MRNVTHQPFNLNSFQDYFHEASMCQDEVEQVMELSEQLLPTLNPNDTETLRQTLKQTTNRLNTVMAKSSRKQEMVESKIKEWKAFQVGCLRLKHYKTQDTQDLSDQV